MISTSIRPEPHIAIPPILRFRRIGGYFYLLCCAVILCFFRLFRLFMRLRARVHSGFPQQIARLAVRTYASPQKGHDITNPLFAALGSGLWLSSSGVGSSASFFAKVNQHISNTECTSAANTIFAFWDQLSIECESPESCPLFFPADLHNSQMELWQSHCNMLYLSLEMCPKCLRPHICASVPSSDGPSPAVYNGIAATRMKRAARHSR